MAKSRTKRKSSDINVKDVQTLANLASEYVRHWTKEQARALAVQELVIIPASWGFQVGKYAVKQNNQVWDVRNSYHELVKNFTSKRSAITWCILEQSRLFKTSDRLLLQDAKLSKLIQDTANYNYTKQAAVKKRDLFMVDVLNARLAETAVLLESAKNELEKTLNSAKYSVDRVLK
jgi:hypothetical protein